MAEELVSGLTTAQFTYGVMRISENRASMVSYYAYDAGGSVRQLLSGGGATTDAYTYDAFGNTVGQTGSTTNEFQYRGEQFDPMLGMYYLRARYYHPLSDRFLTADKYEGEETGACDCSIRNQRIRRHGARHLFAYANSDPVNYIDRSGKDGIFAYLIRFRKPIAVGALSFVLYEELACPAEDLRATLVF